jgi:hypothetical protein
MKKSTVVLLSTVLCASLANAKVQQVFEQPKDTSEFTGVEIDFKADLTFNYQVLEQNYTPLTGNTEDELQPGLVLPAANLDMYGKVMSGFNVLLQTRLASHHHTETYVKGGYATIDNLDFIMPGFASGFMENATIKVGVNDINFGDTQYLRNDNAAMFNNPFVHNLAVESHMEAAFLEILYRIPNSNMFVMGGITNGKENPSDTTESDVSSTTPAFYGKVGYDSQLSEALRFRVNGSYYYSSGNGNSGMYGASKAGAVSENIFGNAGDAGQAWAPMGSYADLGIAKLDTFVKYNDTEFYGTLEFADSDKAYAGDVEVDSEKELMHYAIGIVQRFAGDKLYAAARYESATVETNAAADEELTQYQIGLGWFLSKNAVAKLEYIKQERENIRVDSRGAGHTADPAEFDGFMISTALTF